MYENVPAVLFINEAVPLFVVKPFYCTICQSLALLSYCVPTSMVLPYDNHPKSPKARFPKYYRAIDKLAPKFRISDGLLIGQEKILS